MMQLNIDKDFDGTYCWAVWEMDPEDYCRVGQRGVIKESAGNCHSLTEACAEGVRAMLNLAYAAKKPQTPFKGYTSN